MTALRFWALAWPLACLIALVASVARGDTLRVHIAWQRPAQSMCPSREALSSDLSRELGEVDFVSQAEADVVVRGFVEERITEVYAQLEATRRDGTSLGTRELTAGADRCASLRGSVALVLTLLLEGTAPRADSEAARTAALSGGAWLGGQSGALPRPTIGGGLAFAIDWREKLQVRADLGYWAPVEVEAATGVGGTFQLVSSSLRACPSLWSRARIVLWGCGGAQLSLMVTKGRGLLGADTQVRSLPQLLVDLGARVRVGARSSLSLGAGPVLFLARPEVSYLAANGERNLAHRPALFGALFQLALIIRGR